MKHPWSACAAESSSSPEEVDDAVVVVVVVVVVEGFVVEGFVDIVEKEYLM